MSVTLIKSGESSVGKECRITSLPSIQLPGRILKLSDPSSLSKERKEKVTQLLTQILCDSSLAELQQEGSVNFECKLVLAKEFYLRFEGGDWKKVASFRPFFKKEKASQEDFSVYALYEEIKSAVESNAFPNSGRTSSKKRESGRDRAFERVRIEELQDKETTCIEKASGYVACTGDAVGLTAYSIGLTAGTAAAYLTVGAASSVISIGSGVVIAKSGMKQRAKASEVDDHEGVRLAKIFEAIGWSLGGVGIGFTAFKVSALAGAAKASTLIMYMAIPFYAILSIAALVYGGINLVGSLSFQKKLDACLQDPDNLKQTLVFLRDQITGSDIEAEEVRVKIRHKITKTAKDQRREKADAEWEKYIKKNALKLGRRTSSETVKKILLTVNRLLKDLDDGSVSKEDTIREAKNLIEKVRKENFKTNVKNIIVIVAGTLSVVTVIAVLTTTGPFSLVLMLLLGALWFSFDTSLADRFGEVLWARKCVKNPSTMPELSQRANSLGKVPQAQRRVPEEEPSQEALSFEEIQRRQKALRENVGKEVAQSS